MPGKVVVPVGFSLQYELLACLSLVTDVGKRTSHNSAAASLLDSVWKQISSQGVSTSFDQDGSDNKVEILEHLGEGAVSPGLMQGI